MKVSVAELSKKLKAFYSSGDEWRSRYYIRHFADYLAEQIRGEEIGAEEFLLTVQLAFQDLRRGIDSSTGEMITHDAADRVPTVEIFVRMDLPRLYDLVFPEEFACEVKRVWEEVALEASRSSNINT